MTTSPGAQTRRPLVIGGGATVEGWVGARPAPLLPVRSRLVSWQRVLWIRKTVLGFMLTISMCGWIILSLLCSLGIQTSCVGGLRERSFLLVPFPHTTDPKLSADICAAPAQNRPSCLFVCSLIFIEVNMMRIWDSVSLYGASCSLGIVGALD